MLVIEMFCFSYRRVLVLYFVIVCFLLFIFIQTLNFFFLYFDVFLQIYLLFWFGKISKRGLMVYRDVGRVQVYYFESYDVVMRELQKFLFGVMQLIIFGKGSRIRKATYFVSFSINRFRGWCQDFYWVDRFGVVFFFMLLFM